MRAGAQVQTDAPPQRRAQLVSCQRPIKADGDSARLCVTSTRNQEQFDVRRGSIGSRKTDELQLRPLLGDDRSRELFNFATTGP